MRRSRPTRSRSGNINTPSINTPQSKLITTYKKHRIEKNNGVYEVVSPNKNRFIVSLDDSKSSGRRLFIKEDNNIRSAKKYIDYLES